MNLTEKEVARKIVQRIADDLAILEMNNGLKWHITKNERQTIYREWAQSALNIITNAVDDQCVYVGQFDGSAKPNPGEMKIGGYIKNLKDMDKILYSFSLYKGYGTNNRAEYMGLIELISTALSKGIKRINIYGDSKLAVMQVNRKWKANKDMGPLRDQVLQLLEGFDDWSLSHVPRDLNSEADLLTR